MRVKLLENIYENGGVKVSRRPYNEAVKATVNGKEQTVLVRKSRDTVFVKDAVIEMSDTSARKYIAAGKAVEAKE